MEVRLEYFEMQMGAKVAVDRKLNSIRDRLKQNNYEGGDKEWTEEVESSCAELVVAKALGLYWDGSVDTYKRADIEVLSQGIQVRHTRQPRGRLIIRPRDPEFEYYVLVTGKLPNFVVHGWIFGKDARQDKWWSNMGHEHRPYAWCVPQSDLQPIDTLLDELKRAHELLN